MSVATEQTETQALAKLNASIEGLDVRTVGAIITRSGFFPDIKQDSQAVTKILAGRELGFPPIASMQGVYLVQGRVTLSANLIGAAIQKSGKYRYRVTKMDASGCSIKFYERWNGRWEEVGVSEFTPQDAQQAGLAGKDNYKHFPRNMFFSRALTNGARWYCPEVFNGPIYTPDELGASLDDDGHVIDIPYDEGYASTPVSPSGVTEDAPEDPFQPPAPSADPELAKALERNENLVLDANSMGVKGIGHLRANETWPRDKIEAANITLGAKIANANRAMQQESLG